MDELQNGSGNGYWNAPQLRTGVLLDGSSLQLEHEPELVEAYPPASNQHGKCTGR